MGQINFAVPSQGERGVEGPTVSTAGAALRAVWRGHVPAELAGLWLLEVSGCAVFFHLLLANARDFGLDPWAAQRAAVLGLIFGLVSVAVGLYSSDTYTRTKMLLAASVVGGLLALTSGIVVGAALGVDFTVLVSARTATTLQALCLMALFLFILRAAFAWALRRNAFLRRVIVVGPANEAARTVEAVAGMRPGLFEIAAVLPNAGTAVETARSVRAWGMVLTPSVSVLEPKLRSEGVARVVPDAVFWERVLRRIDVRLWDNSVLTPLSREAAQGGEQQRVAGAVRRAADIVLSIAMLGFTAPLLLVTAIVVRLESPGPAIYRQERVGLHGRVFTVLKFRSMRRDAETNGPMWARQSDPRVTRVGAFIRLVRIDELPQLVNVLRGDMSFIGPRPERPFFVAQLEKALPDYAERAMVKPGLTGWAQVNYPYGASIEDAQAKLSYDLYYVRHRTLLLDCLILLATVRVVLFQRGAR